MPSMKLRWSICVRWMDIFFLVARGRFYRLIRALFVLFRDRLNLMTSNGRDFLSLCLLMRLERWIGTTTGRGRARERFRFRFLRQLLCELRRRCRVVDLCVRASALFRLRSTRVVHPVSPFRSSICYCYILYWSIRTTTRERLRRLRSNASTSSRQPYVCSYSHRDTSQPYRATALNSDRSIPSGDIFVRPSLPRPRRRERFR